ncbi:hypothetical protein BJ138DRAFT_853320 [Hygrophoropsis aurantiaca]|uniref:Uncharacterized protein n=1 Tax=Hygrophoropsis aurantiaca TaxID=72124 RepID=A0ACB7ZVH8_9AGAM|nr:hypothetical protein BJ138DRAFT_853320 [Hygrophoropsis aurantiaca]
MHRQIGNTVPWPVSIALGWELRSALMKPWVKDQESGFGSLWGWRLSEAGIVIKSEGCVGKKCCIGKYYIGVFLLLLGCS